MKKILITGANSYIGTSFEKWMAQYDEYEIDTIDMIDGSWREYDFSKYDVVFHVAGIAHADTKALSEEEQNRYYEVNTNLTIEVAQKAKMENVKQFIFMSSMIVFGTKQERITKTTQPQPDSFYGNSKLLADIGIQKLQSNGFNIVSLRPPMIYGKNCKGNYVRLAGLAKKIPIFPDYPNKRSMLYVENLCEFIRLMIENKEKGYFYPQNENFVKTSDMVKEIARVSGKPVICTKLFNPLIKFLIKKNKTANKIFGNKYYEKSMSEYNKHYNKISFEKSIERTEK